MSTKIVSMINMKGGVGKTTLCVLLSYVLAKYDSKNILVVDVDPQFNASLCLLGYDDYLKKVSNSSTRSTVVDLFTGAVEEYPGIAKKHTVKKDLTLSSLALSILDDPGRLELIPSKLNLVDIENSPRGTEHKLKSYLDKIKEKYDYILIDCPPTASIYSLSALIASDYFLIPVKTDYLSSIGIPLLEKWIHDRKKIYGLGVNKLGLVFTMVHGSHTVDQTTMSQVKKLHKKYIFSGYVKETTRIKRGIVEAKELIAKNKDIKTQLLEISREFIKRLEV